MSKNHKEHKYEHHYNKAKKEGYRARSAYKLIEIEKRYNIFKRGFYILDLGSAPGSWLQVLKSAAEENLEKYRDQYYHRGHYRILGIDINHVTPIESITILKIDLTSPQIFKEIESFFGGEHVDLITSDASINKSGNKFSDQARQANLCREILELSQFLKKGGNMVLKAFQGADFDGVFTKMRERFVKLYSFKPRASYKKSNEIYLIGLKKK